MRNRIIKCAAVFLMFAVFVSMQLFAEEKKPVVIALPGFLDFSRCPSAGAQTMALRDRVISDLIRNYDCVILSRSQGISLAAEHELNTIKEMDSNKPDPITLYSADYALIGYFKIARMTPGARNSVDLGCTMLLTDLRQNGDSNFRKIEFIPKESTLYSDDITKEIVKALKLFPKTKKDVVQTGKLDETWAVLPIQHFESSKALKQPPDKDLAMMIELALQQTGNLKQIVDHNEIDKVLLEMKISCLSGATESFAGNVAKLVKADKIITGSVSRACLSKKDLRLELFLVDGNTAVILDAESATVPPEKITETASELVKNFTGRKQVIPELKSADPELLGKEAYSYEEVLRSISMNNGEEEARFAKILAETVYLLAGKDDARILKMTQYLQFNIVKPHFTADQKKELLELTEKLYSRIKISEATKNALADRGLAVSELGRPDEGIALAEECIKRFPEKPAYAYSVIGRCYIAKKDYAKAIEYGKKGQDVIAGLWVLLDAYQTLKDPANDPAELETLKLLKPEKDYMSFNLLRRLQLTREIEGPDAAFSFSKKIGSWDRARPEIQLELAKAHIAKGNTEYAGMLLSILDDKNAQKRTKYKTTAEKQKLAKEIKELREKTGSVKVQWYTFASGKKIPDNYKFYIQPAGNPDMKMIKNAVVEAEKFLGAKIEILPDILLPDDPFCFKKGRGQYSTFGVIHRIKTAVTLPDDAIGFIIITGKDLFRDPYRFVYGDTLCWVKIISYYRWYDVGPAVITDMLAKEIASSACPGFELYSCDFPLCLCSNDGDADGNKYKKFSLCKKCWEKLQESDPEKVYKKLHHEYNLNIRLKGDKKEWMEDYLKIVREKLSANPEKRP